MEVTYGYIIFPSLCSVIQRLSEILILFGYSSLSPAFTAGSTDTLDPGRDIPWASLLSILGLYQLGLQFAVCFAWLGAVDLRAINDIATAQSGFYIAYASLQFILTLVVVTIALFKTQEVDDLQTTLEHHGNFEVHDATQMFLSVGVQPLNQNPPRPRGILGPEWPFLMHRLTTLLPSSSTGSCNSLVCFSSYGPSASWSSSDTCCEIHSSS